MKSIGMKTKAALACCLMAAATTAFAQAKSPKRGICWDEKTQKFSDAPIDKMLPGISWIYTWGGGPAGFRCESRQRQRHRFRPDGMGPELQ